MTKSERRKPPGRGVRSHMVVGRYHLIATKYQPISEKYTRLSILEWTVFLGSMPIGLVRYNRNQSYTASWPDGTMPTTAEDPITAVRHLLGG